MLLLLRKKSRGTPASAGSALAPVLLAGLGCSWLRRRCTQLGALRFMSNPPIDISALLAAVTPLQALRAAFLARRQITDNLPPSPVTVAGATKKLKLVPFGLTNIRIAVFPWSK